MHPPSQDAAKLAARSFERRDFKMMAVSALAIASCLAVAGPGKAAGSTPYKAPLTSWGKPDLDGNWTNSSITRLERDPIYGNRIEMTPDEVKHLEGDRQALVTKQSAPTDPNATLNQINASCEVKGYTGGPACGYNGAWTDPGDLVMRVGGKPRTSFITSTPDGRVPLTKTGARPSQRAGGEEEGPPREAHDARGNGSGRRLPPGVQQDDNPEGRSLGERCIMSFGFSSGPVMQPQLYNSNYQFVQTKDELAIMVEMVHDVRHIHIGGKHRTDGVRPWMGDSIAWWEGNTLVAETTSFNPQQTFYNADQNLKVTERFTRIGPQRMHYEFKVEDPTVWDQPWSGEYEFGPSKGPLYEYACHEGNYGLEGILAGARDQVAHAKAASR